MPGSSEGGGREHGARISEGIISTTSLSARAGADLIAGALRNNPAELAASETFNEESTAVMCAARRERRQLRRQYQMGRAQALDPQAIEATRRCGCRLCRVALRTYAPANL